MKGKKEERSRVLSLEPGGGKKEKKNKVGRERGNSWELGKKRGEVRSGGPRRGRHEGGGEGKQRKPQNAPARGKKKEEENLLLQRRERGMERRGKKRKDEPYRLTCPSRKKIGEGKNVRESIVGRGGKKSRVPGEEKGAFEDSFPATV